jgi:hypothetical protein
MHVKNLTRSNQLSGGINFYTIMLSTGQLMDKKTLGIEVLQNFVA